MSKVTAPNKEYNGISAGVQFTNGVGECTNPNTLQWFKEKGYEVELDEPEKKNTGDNAGKTGNDENTGKTGNPDFSNMSIEELKMYAEANNIDLGKSTSFNGILKKIEQAVDAQ